MNNLWLALFDQIISEKIYCDLLRNTKSRILYCVWNFALAYYYLTVLFLITTVADTGDFSVILLLQLLRDPKCLFSFSKRTFASACGFHFFSCCPCQCRQAQVIYFLLFGVVIGSSVKLGHGKDKVVVWL